MFARLDQAQTQLVDKAVLDKFGSKLSGGCLLSIQPPFCRASLHRHGGTHSYLVPTHILLLGYASFTPTKPPRFRDPLADGSERGV
jgi:hypothetical protein